MPRALSWVGLDVWVVAWSPRAMQGDPKMWAIAGRYSALGLEMALSVAIGIFGGEWLDERFATKPYLGYAGLAIGLGAAIMAFVRVAKAARKEVR
jgi:ATP synthase protein I